MNVALYNRISTPHQKNYGLSLDDQADRLRAAYPEGALYTDPKAVSGKVPLAKRPAGAELLAAIERGEVRRVVVTKLDRMFRSMVDAVVVVTEWRRRGVEFCILDFGGMAFDTGSAAGACMFHMFAAFAQFERDIIGERTRDAYAAASRNGVAMGRLGTGVASLNPELLAYMRALREKGYGYREIARQLTAEGVPTKTGRPWHHSTVQYILHGQRTTS